MIHPIGKGYFIWQIERCGGGDPQRLAQMAVASGLSWVTIKTHNGTLPRNGDILPIVRALEAVNVECWGWGYCYGIDPVGEALLAAYKTHQYGLAGYFIDAEREYKAPGMRAKASLFMGELVPRMEGKSIGLCAFRFPSFHQTFPWDEFLAGSAFHAPQVYWLEDDRPMAPVMDLNRSIVELTALADIPFVPIGVASSNDAGTWEPTVVQVDLFDKAVQDKGLPGIGWWSWQHAERDREIWDAIAAHQWSGGPAEKPVDRIIRSATEIEVELESE